MTGAADSVMNGKMVKSAERTIELLELLAAADGPLTTTEIHELTGYPRSSLHWLLHTLVQLHWLEFSDADGGYRVGARVLLCGTSYLDKDPAMQFVPAVLERIRNDTGYTTHFARLDNADVVYLATRQAVDLRRLSSRVGRKLPATATSLGKAVLADYTAAEITARLGSGPFEKLTEHTTETLQELATELEETRRTGYSVESEQNTPGLFCVGAAVPYRIPATDAISCSIPLQDATAEEVKKVGGILKAAAAELARTLSAAGVR